MTVYSVFDKIVLQKERGGCMEKWVVKSLELLVKLSFLGKKYPAVLPYTPQKLEVSG